MTRGDPSLYDMAIPDRRRWGRGILMLGWAQCYPGEPYSIAALQILQAMTEGEGWYGYAGKPVGWKGSNNWGAITCNHGPPCDEVSCFQAGDYNPASGAYQTCFKLYPDPVSGAADFIHHALDIYRGYDCAINGDVLGFARALRQPPPYYLGDSSDPETAAQHYAAGLASRIESICADLGEDNYTSMSGPAVDPGLMAANFWQRVSGAVTNLVKKVYNAFTE